MLKGFIISIIALEENGSLISVNPGLIFWTVVTFIVLLILLKRVAWKPILTALDQREAAIRESLDKADKAREEAQRVLDENKSNLAKAEEESKKIIDQGRAYAEKIKEQIIRDSKEQAKKIVEDASEEIERKKQEAFSDLKNQVAEIAVNAAEKILRENLNKDLNKKIVDKYIRDISRN